MDCPDENPAEGTCDNEAATGSCVDNHSEDKDNQEETSNNLEEPTESILQDQAPDPESIAETESISDTASSSSSAVTASSVLRRRNRKLESENNSRPGSPAHLRSHPVRGNIGLHGIHATQSIYII